MAENKKSVILYVDIIHTFEGLEDDEAGRLIKHFLRYINDLNPEPPDKLTKVAFEPIKQQLKRDLTKWEEERIERAKSGKLGGIKSGETRRRKIKQNEASASSACENEANEAVNVNVIDIVNDNVNNINIPPLEDFLTFARGIVGLDYDQLKKSIELKYMAWKENGWKTGKDKKIKNWKSTLLNTIQYLEKEKISGKKESLADNLKRTAKSIGL